MATEKASTKKSAARKTSAKKAPAKTVAKKAPAKVPAKKSAAKKTVAKTAPAKKSAAKKSAARKYSPAAGKQVGREMHEMHQGKLKMGRSGKKVINPKQAIAIGLSEARRAGKKVPPNPNDPKKE
jgi:hypothetical protein